jgi:WD40 repeat protein
MAPIGAIAFTPPDGRQIVSASDDKTIRVWDLATGKTVRIIRGEVTPGTPGSIYSMVLSRDGQWLAVGGNISARKERIAAIRLYEFASGRLVGLLEGHIDVVHCLAFSPDGQHLISGSADRTAVLWDVGTGRRLRRLAGHGDVIYAVGFTADSARAVTGSYDHTLRLWRVADGRQIARMPGHPDKVYSLAIAGDHCIASGDLGGEIRLWDDRTGMFLRVLARRRGGISSLSFNSDGTALLSGERHVAKNCHVYDVASGRKIITYRGHDNTVSATAISLDGRSAATGGGDNHEIHIWDLNTGRRPLDPGGQQPLTLSGHGRVVWAVGFSADGRRIGWGNVHSQESIDRHRPLQHALTLPSTGNALPRVDWLSETEAVTFYRGVASMGGWKLQHREGGDFGLPAILDITHNGHRGSSIKRGPTDGYGHRAYGFTPDGETVISGGSNGVLTAYDRAGNKRGDFIGHEGDVMAVAPSPDGRLLVSGAIDQTARLWNLATRELLVTLFHGADGEWVMWTPQGYYIASPEGDKYVGWQINRGPRKEADYVRASQLAGKLFRPDIITRAIQLGSAKAALVERGAPDDILGALGVSRPPDIRILLPEDGSTLNDSPASVVIEAAQNPDPVEGYDIIVNGRQVATRELHFLGAVDERPERRILPVPLQSGENAIRILARNHVGTSDPCELRLRLLGSGDLDRRGILYIVAIGVDDYPHCQAKNLSFAGADARVFCETMMRHAGPLHERCECLLLAKGGDRQPTRAEIENAMLLFREAGPRDTVALFLAGHGINDGDNYVFLPQDAAESDGYFLPASVVRWHVFQEALHQAAGWRLMFVDTCHAGGAYNARLVKQTHDADIVVFSATDGHTPAQELERLGHGAFTFALTLGLAGEAAIDGGDIDLSGLMRYVSREVKRLTNGVQTPEINLLKIKDFVIARQQ